MQRSITPGSLRVYLRWQMPQHVTHRNEANIFQISSSYSCLQKRKEEEEEEKEDGRTDGGCRRGEGLIKDLARTWAPAAASKRNTRTWSLASLNFAGPAAAAVGGGSPSGGGA